MKLETKNIVLGAGLISLDVLIWDGKRIPVAYYVGGTCGNVMMILAHMGDAMVSQRWVNLNVFNPSTSQWTVEKFYLANPSTGDYAYLRPYAALPANSRISGTIIMPIIRSLATNEQWS